jgi:hypothetical protein
MTESTVIPSGLSEVGHTHSDVSGAALRALVFGAMDGLVTNVALVAGVGAAGAAPRFIVLTDLAGLIAGAFSMAMGDYTSVRTQNEQVDREWAKEAAEIQENSQAEEHELAMMFGSMGMTTRSPSLRRAVGDLDRVGIVQMLVFVASTPELGEQARAADAASDLLVEVLGENGRHARTAIGVAGLPRNSPVEIQMVCTAV